MEKQIAQFTNRGMYQDTSISKATNEFAFENYNIRITPFEDHTLFSVINEKLDKDVEVLLNTGETIITGKYLGHCLLNDYIILFTTGTTDRIYRLVYNESYDRLDGTVLYDGHLNFQTNIECISYYESEDVQKVYWVDGVNFNRFINIKMTPVSYTEEEVDSRFDFNPEISTFPNISVTKEYKGNGLFPSRIIQYSISYYNKYGIETPILTSSDINYIDYNDRGASADDILNCSFKITVDNIDTSYDYLRVYSLKRTSYNSDIQFNLVKDMNIENQSEIIVIDDNTNQSVLDPNLLFFVGGKEFYSSTIDYKDDTLFFGNIKVSKNPIDENLKTLITSTIIDNTETNIKEASLITFGNKEIPLGDTKGFYSYHKQSSDSSNTFKTFKRGEIYRFAIQFQTKRGEWTNPIWIGDKICDVCPVVNEETKTATVANPVCTLNEDIISNASSYVNYRILMANTSQDRTIKAQGVICPTVFNYEERLDDKTYALSSWIMRPRKSNASWQHMSSTSNEIQGTNNLAPVANNDGSVNVDNSEPIIFTAKMIYLHPYAGHGCQVAIRAGRYIDGTPPTWDETQVSYLIKSIDINKGTWKATFEKVKNFIAEHTNKNLEEDLGVSFDTFKEFAKTPLSNTSEASILGMNWTDFDFSQYTSVFNLENPSNGRGYAYTVIIEKDEETVNIKTDINIQEKKNNFYVDNSIVTFHSPDIENNPHIFKNNNLKFRIVGIVPITSNYSDAEIELKQQGLSSASNINKNNIVNNPNLSENTETLISNPLYRDFDWKYQVDGNTGFGGYLPTSNLIDYNIYMWHKQGSLVGQNELCFNTENGNTFDNVIAELKDKTFATQRFSYTTRYSDFWTCNISPTQYFDSSNIEYLQIELPNDKKVFYSGNYDKLLTSTNGYKVNSLTVYDPVRLKYKSTPHVVFSLWNADNSKLATLPIMSDENESFSEIYGLASEPVYPWQVNNLISKSKTKTFGFYHFPSDGTLTKEYANTIWNSIIQNYIGEDKAGAILYKEDNSVFYIFLCDMFSTPYIGDGYPSLSSLTGIIKVIVKNNSLTLPTITYGSLFDFPELLGKTFDLCEITNGHSIGEEYNVMTKVEDYEQGTLIEFYTNPISQQPSFKYVTKDIDYNRPLTSEELNSEGYAYLYLAELYEDVDYNSLYGGTDENSLELIDWIPITSNTKIEESTSNAEGDTYFQRWDCLKTYPYTEEDINKVVDITSFMVETHINLEGRYDKNIGTTNILTTRPSNFNLFNDVYNQPNNIFTYNILDSKYYNKNYENQILWSLQKVPTADIDVWTNISMSSAINLNGSLGKINKIINNNDTILAFQDKAISVVNFNNRTALSTEEGIPVEIANSGKVDGYRVITDSIGCQNKQLMVKANSGLYFIDNNNKSLFRINGEGLNNVSNNGMSVWFKNNTDVIKYLNYDSLLHDVYITTNSKSLLFNEDLNNFTTFLTFITGLTPTIFNQKGNIFSFKNIRESRDLYNNYFRVLHKGDYTNDYAITYRVNPDPYLDKVFTNIEYIADLYNVNNEYRSENPFSSIFVHNEYQAGTSKISNSKYPTSKKKFRIWRFDIPRDGNSKYKLDRIRNPWINISLYSNKDESLTNSRLEFHNLNVYYYK